VTVIVYVPDAVAAPTDTVSVEEPPAVTDAGLKLADAPNGRPLALRLTDCAAPLVIAVEIVEVPLEPWATLRAFGLALIEKSFTTAAVTVSVTESPCVTLVPVAVTSIVYVPGAAEVGTDTVIVDEPPAVTDEGLKVSVGPVGNTFALKLTVCADPFVTVVEIVELPLDPCTTLRLLGLALTEKSSAAAGVMVSETDVVCVALVPLPVTVRAYVPGTALPVMTSNLDVPPAVTDVGVKFAEAPGGRPLALKVTVCAAPLVTAVEIVEAALNPSTTLTLDGFALIEKSSAVADVTVSDTEVVCVALVPVPVTVIAYIPGAGAVPAPTDRVSVDELPAVTEVGLKLADTPNGKPLTLRLTDCAAPLVTAVEIVEVPLDPCTTVSALGLAPIEKSDCCVPPQLGNLKEPIRVCQLKLPDEARYSSVYQNVQSSEGSTLMLV